jgi:hypothetical protein
MNYFILQDNETKGPYTMPQLRAMWNTGVITSQTLHVAEGYKEWRPLAPYVEPRPQPPPPSIVSGVFWGLFWFFGMLAMLLAFILCL